MRILYIDVNTVHINPTANFLPLMLLEISNDITFFGPGYVNSELIKNGVLKFIKNKKTFDIVFYGPTCPMMSKDHEEEIVKYCKTSTANNIEPNILLTFFKDINTNFKYLEIGIQTISILNYDYYSDPGRVLDIVDKNSFYLIGPNEQFMSKVQDLPNFAKEEKHFKRKQGNFSDRWYNYISKNPNRHITALHFISIEEFFFEPLVLRNYEVSVPGVEYYQRKKALNILRKSNFKSSPKIIFNLFRAMNFLKIPVYKNKLGINLYNSTFKNILRNTKYVYTARGGFGIPVRKFFEIPASGSLLICDPCLGYAELGFITGKHYIKSDPDQLLDVLNEWSGIPETQRIASNGRELVFSKHSLKARAEQIKNCFKKILLKNYSSSRWVKGKYIIK